MRELDLLFEKFLARDFDALDEPHLLALENLLLEPDQDILAWLMNSRPAPVELEHIVETIQAALE